MSCSVVLPITFGLAHFNCPAALSASPTLPITFCLSLLSFPGCYVLAVLFQNSSPDRPALAVLFRLSTSACPPPPSCLSVLSILFLLLHSAYAACPVVPVLPVLLWLSHSDFSPIYYCARRDCVVHKRMNANGFIAIWFILLKQTSIGKKLEYGCLVQAVQFCFSFLPVPFWLSFWAFLHQLTYPGCAVPSFSGRI